MKIVRNGRFHDVLSTPVFLFFLLVGHGISLAVPHAEVDQPVWNFGAVTNLAGLTHDFIIRNSGDSPLKIHHVLSSCNACLRVGIEKTNLPAGSTTVLHSFLDLRLLSGTVSRAILVDCNDPKNPSFALELTGLVVPAYQLNPAEINLDLSQGQTAGTMEILPLFKLHADLSQVFCDDTNLEIAISPRQAAGFLLAVQVGKNRPRGNGVVRATVRSPDTNDLPCYVNIFFHHPPDVELLPARLLFKPQAEPQTRILWVKQHGTAPLTLLDAVPSSDKIHCEIDPDPAGLNYRIYVTAWQQAPMAGQTNMLTLKFKDSLNQAKSLTVSVFVEQPWPEAK